MSDKNIDKDIENIKELIKNANTEDADMNDCFGGEHIESIENILKELERLRYENKFLDKKAYELNGKYIKDIELNNTYIYLQNKEIATLNKIAEKLAEDLSISEVLPYYRKSVEYIIENARKEVTKVE